MNDYIEIHLMNKQTRVFEKNIAVFPENTMGQIAEGYHKKLGIDLESPIRFENKRTGDSSNDRYATVAELKLMAGDVLILWDDSQVA